MKKIDIFIYLGVFCLLASFSFFCVYKGLDPDFGWHIHTGQLILERGVPHQDWYSYTMPNYPWIDHEWLTDVSIYLTYSHFGFYFLLALFLIIYTFSFFIVKRRGQKSWEFFVPVILGYLATIALLGVRPQLLTVFFVAILLSIIYRFLENPSSKLIYFLPILFLIWVNLHGGFVIGLLILFLYLALEIFKRTIFFKKIISWKFFKGQKFREAPNRTIVTLLVLLIVCYFVTFLNPYGPGLYKSADLGSMSDFFLRFHIAEWMPIFFAGFNLFICLYLSAFIGFFIMFFRRIEFNDTVLSIIFLCFALLSIRNVLIFVILTVSIFCELAVCLKQDWNFKFDFAKYSWLNTKSKRMVICYLVGFLIVAGIGFYGYNFFSHESMTGYPEKAVSFLKTLPLSENIFNDYGWGGYLIWKLPERKYFIDGRMPSWRENNQFVFGDYVKIGQAKEGFDKILQKYNVSLVLVSKNLKDQVAASNNSQSIAIKAFFVKHKILAFILGISTNNNVYDELTKLGWKTIYQDDVAVILKK